MKRVPCATPKAAWQHHILKAEEAAAPTFVIRNPGNIPASWNHHPAQPGGGRSPCPKERRGCKHQPRVSQSSLGKGHDPAQFPNAVPIARCDHREHILHFRILQHRSCSTSAHEPGEGEKPARCQNHITPHLAVTKDDSGEFVLIIAIPRTSEPPPTALPSIKPLLQQRAKGARTH